MNLRRREGCRFSVLRLRASCNPSYIHLTYIFNILASNQAVKTTELWHWSRGVLVRALIEGFKFKPLILRPVRITYEEKHPPLPPVNNEAHTPKDK